VTDVTASLSEADASVAGPAEWLELLLISAKCALTRRSTAQGGALTGLAEGRPRRRFAWPRGARSACVCFEHDRNGEVTRTSDSPEAAHATITITNGAFPWLFETGMNLRWT
jgi:hypothetical protein